MAQLPSKLIEKLNTMIPELGDHKLGTLLQACLDQIAGSSAGTVLLPVFPSQASYAVSNSVVEGSVFANSNTKTINYFVCGLWHEIDIPSLQAQITANAGQIALNVADIINLNAQLVSLTTAFNGHTHDGVNTQKIQIKGQLATTGVQGHVLYVNAGMVDCMEIDPTLDVYSEGNLVEDLALGINFVDDCFTVTTVGQVAQVTAPALKNALVDISNNTAAIAANVASIAALNVAIATLNTNVAQNATDIANNYAQFLSHDHTGGINGPQLDPIGALVSPDGGGTIVNDWLLTADGAGGVKWLNPAVLTMPVNLCGTNIGNASATDIFIQVNPLDDCYEFRKLNGECGIGVSIDGTDDHINIAIDFATMNDVGTAVDPLNDFILVNDVSTGLCVKTTVANLLSGTTSYVGGKNITVTPTGTPNVSEVSLDLGSIVTASTVSALDPVNDFVVVYDDSASDCVKIPVSELLHPIDSIDDLSDVDTSTVIPTSGQTLVWDGANWIPGTPASLLNDLTDVCVEASSSTNTLYNQAVHSTDTISIVGGGFRAFTFTPTVSGTAINNLQLQLFQQIAPTSGTVTVQIVQTVAGLPDESVVIATSDPDSLTGLPVAPSSAPRDFNFSTPFALNAGTEYAVYFDASSLVGGNIAIRSTGATTVPGGSYFKGAALDPWSLNNDRDAYAVLTEEITTPGPVDCDVLKFNGTSMKWEHKALEETQSTRCELAGTSPGVVGELVYNNAGTWTLSDHNDGTGEAAATHMIVSVGSGVYEIQAIGPFDGLIGLVPGEYYWGDPAVVGGWTTTRPSNNGETENPAFRAISATKAELTLNTQPTLIGLSAGADFLSSRVDNSAVGTLSVFIEPVGSEIVIPANTPYILNGTVHFHSAGGSAGFVRTQAVYSSTTGPTFTPLNTVGTVHGYDGLHVQDADGAVNISTHTLPTLRVEFPVDTTVHILSMSEAGTVANQEFDVALYAEKIYK